MENSDNLFTGNSMNKKLTPMMKQYFEIKKNHQSEILFFRMGDFYEMFFEDAEIASKILDIALTSRQNDVPMCGIPYHAAESYLARLIKAGKRVAICEQLETVPSEGTIVKREVVRILTPGTIIEQNLLQSDENNFLSSIFIGDKKIGLTFVDISTGDFYITSIEKNLELFRGEISRYAPKEIVFKETGNEEDLKFSEQIKSTNIPIYRINEWLYDLDYLKNLFCEIYNIASLKGLGITDEIDIISGGSILQYLKETQKQICSHLKNPKKISQLNEMILDEATINNLELTKNQQDFSKKKTLFSILNYTKTAMGSRILEHNILHPLVHKESIEKRLDVVQYFYNFHDFLRSTEEILKNIQDIERIATRFSMNKIAPRYFIALKISIKEALTIKSLFKKQPNDLINELAEDIPDLLGLYKKIDKTISEDPAISPEQGQVLKKGFSEKLDHLYELKNNAKNWILKYQEEEKKKYKISTLRIKYNKIIGYFIEISKGQSDKAPKEYSKKQTLVSSERFTSDELQKLERNILSSSEKIIVIEKEEIEKLKNEIVAKKNQLQKMASTIASIDYFFALAKSAMENNFHRPTFNDTTTNIINGRHPLVEKYYTKEVFIPNDIFLDDKDEIIKIITGPNMSGKSTYIRTLAIIQLMAQIGSFTPSDESTLTIADRIFTRIGASDNISRGESTFLVEMNETANIINNATDKSIIIMDEVGRGTSTYDGLSIAWAIVEYILRFLKSKTLFATHYHELTQLEKHKGIVNYTVMVKEHFDGVDFLHKVTTGFADKSYGIHVAKLAGLPSEIIEKSKKTLDKLEKNYRKGYSKKETIKEESEQLEIFNASNHIVINALKKIDVNSLTPIDAINEINRLKKLID